jgi:DNA-binding NarL/FixJ family response regulator
LNSINVLIVDDNEKFLESAIKYLTTDPHFSVVGWAFNAAEAFQKIEKFKPDLVLLDYSLPDMNGFAVTRKLKASPDAPAIIIISVNDQAEYSSEALNEGADAFITKSDFGNKIIPVIDSLFQKKQ